MRKMVSFVRCRLSNARNSVAHEQIWWCVRIKMICKHIAVQCYVRHVVNIFSIRWLYIAHSRFGSYNVCKFVWVLAHNRWGWKTPIILFTSTHRLNLFQIVFLHECVTLFFPLLYAVDSFCIYSFIVPYNSLNSFHSLQLLLLSLPCLPPEEVELSSQLRNATKIEK